MRKPRLVQPPGSERIDPLVYERIKLTSRRVWKEMHDLQEYKHKKGLCELGLMCGAKATEWRGVRGGCAHHMAALRSGTKLRMLEGYHTLYYQLRQKEIAAEREAAREKRRIEGEKDKAREKLKKSKAA